MISIDTWPLILQIREICSNVGELKFISVGAGNSGYRMVANERLEDEQILIVTDESTQLGETDKAIIHCYHPFSIDIFGQAGFDAATSDFLKRYLPYALLPHFAQKHDEVFVISHLAQTLDGKIASVSGDSRWIGNEENLVHAHRMRALCDAVMVGATTHKIDKPRLNVRHVEGQDPLKVVVGSGMEASIARENGKVFIDTSDFEQVNGHQKDVTQILKALKERGVTSVYLEGGAATTSSFLKQGEIDQLQIHFSCKILGSGKQGYNFDGIESIGECIQFKNPRFVPVGNEMMFLGEL